MSVSPSVEEITSHIEGMLDGDYNDGLNMHLSALKIENNVISLVTRDADSGHQERYLIRVTRAL